MPRRQRRQAATVLAQASAGVANASFEKLYAQLSGVLAAPGVLAHAAPTPLGRGILVPTQVAKGSTLLSVEYFNLLCVTDEPAKGAALGRRALEDWQLLHGRLPPLLNRYLLSDEGDWFVRLAAWLLWLKQNATGPWRLYVDMLPKVRLDKVKCLLAHMPPVIRIWRCV